MITKINKDSLRDLSDFLELLQQATKSLERSATPDVHLVLLVLRPLKKHCESVTSGVDLVNLKRVSRREFLSKQAPCYMLFST